MTRRRYLSRQRAWTVIARQIVSAPDAVGLCFRINTLWWGDQITLDTLLAMREQLWGHMDEHDPRINEHEYVYNDKTEQEPRCLAALWMAHEAQDTDTTTTHEDR